MKSGNKNLIAGNWKMNGLKKDLSFLRNLLLFIKNKNLKSTEILICPPFTLIDTFSNLSKNTPLKIGAQDCHFEESGAYTGEISANMLKNLGVSYVILGHSERRRYCKENNHLINSKIKIAQKSGLKTILCIGETLSERKKKSTLRVIGRQIKDSLKGNIDPMNLEIAYEPVWAIGTGQIPSAEDIFLVHAFIKDKLDSFYGKKAKNIRILYGGSVNSKNISSIFGIDNVTGALIGGGSLKISEFKSLVVQSFKY